VDIGGDGDNSNTTLTDKLSQLSQAGIQAAAIVLCTAVKLHLQAWGASVGVEQHAEVLQRSPVVSAAAVRLVMELQLLLAERLHALQQQEQQQLPDGLQHAAFMALGAWMALDGSFSRQLHAAVLAGLGESLQQLRQQSGRLFPRALAAPVFLDRTGWGQ
jgi:hypothetical protein